MFACRSLLGLVYWGRLGTLQKCRPAIVAFPCIKSSSRGRDSHLSVIALIKYPSLMPLYIYSVSLETHKASFSDLCDETSLHYLPGTFWWNKRPIEQSFEMNKYGKRGEEKSRQCSGTKSFIHMDVVHALSSFPQWPSWERGVGQGRAKAGHWRFLSGFLTSYSYPTWSLAPWTPCLLCSARLVPSKTPEGNGILGLKGRF